MPISVVMPALEIAQETGKVISWLKKEGEAVAKGEPLLEIETDKAVMEIESPADGVLAGVKAGAGAEIEVGRTIAWIVGPGEAMPNESTSKETNAESERTLGRETSGLSGERTIGKVGGAESAREVRISPKARRLAAEKGVDLARVRGSGAAGEILAADVLAAADAIASAGDRGSGSSLPLSSVARLMAERTTQGWTTVPHFLVTRELDATALNEARQGLIGEVDKKYGVKLTHSDLLVALVARALGKHPRMNASWAGDGVRLNDGINISVAMAVEDGVVAPVIPQADRMKLGAIALVRRELSERARAKKLRPGDLAGGTFTISNLGMFEVDSFTAVITPPQAAILAVGRIAERVVAMEGQAAIRPFFSMTLSADHRVVDGARAAEFMLDLAEAVANPRRWIGEE